MSKSLFVAGTGTDVGKTYVAGLILKQLHEKGFRAAYFKAAMSGNCRDKNGTLLPGDSLHVKEVSGIPQPLESMCPYLYETAVSPHLASKMEGDPVVLENVLQCFDGLCETYDWVVAEGSGGIVCPLRYDHIKIGLEDFIRARRLNCLVVADAGLGTINAVVLTAEYMKARGISVRGIILNRYEHGNPLHEDNKWMCERMTGIGVVGTVSDGQANLDIPPETLRSLFKKNGEPR